MLLLRSISQSCVSSLQDSLTILMKRRLEFNIENEEMNNVFLFYRIADAEALPRSTASTPSPQPSTAMPNLSGKELSQSYNSGTSGKSNLSVGLSSQSGSYSSLNKISRYN